MAIVPPPHASCTKTDAHSTMHPELGVHDTMRHGLRSMRDESAAATMHPVQHRLERWDETQRNWKMAMYRNTFGLGMPVRMMMERKNVAYTPHMPAKHVSNIHLDVLDGRDEVLDPVDFLPSNVTGENRLGSDMHSAMEQKWRV